MNTATSSWIPRSRINFAIVIALVSAIASVVGSVWSLAALALLVPAFGAAWAAFLMLWIRRQLSPRGGDWERRIHELVVSRLALRSDSGASLLDIGCGNASLLIALLGNTPAVRATGVDFWGENWDYAQSSCELRLASVGLHAAFCRMDAARLEFPNVMCFHEVETPPGTMVRGPLVALSEALRVLRTGGDFVLVDRFGDKTDFGNSAELAAMLQATTGLRRELLVATLGIPWPLRTKRALGPVEVLSGKKIAEPRETAT